MTFVIKNTGFNDKMPFKMQFYNNNYILNGILPFKIACKILNIFVIKNVSFAISVTAYLFCFFLNERSPYSNLPICLNFFFG